MAKVTDGTNHPPLSIRRLAAQRARPAQNASEFQSLNVLITIFRDEAHFVLSQYQTQESNSSCQDISRILPVFEGSLIRRKRRIRQCKVEFKSIQAFEKLFSLPASSD
jgi:hypothetical protein